MLGKRYKQVPDAWYNTDDVHVIIPRTKQRKELGNQRNKQLEYYPIIGLRALKPTGNPCKTTRCSTDRKSQ